jgi:hypothetical protein
MPSGTISRSWDSEYSSVIAPPPTPSSPTQTFPELTGTVTETQTLTAPNGRTYTTKKTVPATKAFTTVTSTTHSHDETCKHTTVVPDADVTTHRETVTLTNTHGVPYTTVEEVPTETFAPWTSVYTHGNRHYTVYHDKSSTLEDIWEDTPTYTVEPADWGWSGVHQPTTYYPDTTGDHPWDLPSWTPTT